MYSIQSNGLVRMQEKEVIPFEQAFDKFGCVSNQDMRTIVELIAACKKKIRVNFAEAGIEIYGLYADGLKGLKSGPVEVELPDAYGKFQCSTWNDVRTLLEMQAKCRK